LNFVENNITTPFAIIKSACIFKMRLVDCSIDVKSAPPLPLYL